MKLTEEQQSALRRIVELRNQRRKEILVAGPAGTGKTTLIRELINLLPHVDIAVVTPTNKAAKVLNTKGVKASTLYSKFFTPETELVPKLTPEEEAALRAAGQEAKIAQLKQQERERSKKVHYVPNYEVRASLNTDAAIERWNKSGKTAFTDTIILDEASMLQTWLLKHLHRMCNTLILVGDPYQLPPVNDKANPRGYFCVSPPDVSLQTVMRQAEGSPILDLATHIRNGRFPDALVRTMMPDTDFRTWFRPDRKIIAYTNAHRREVNALARQVLGRKSILPQAGDILVCNTNTDEGLLNGSEVKVLEFVWKRKDDKAKMGQRGKPTLEGPLDATLVYEDEDGATGTTLLNMGEFLSDLPDGALSAWDTEGFIQVSRENGLGHSFSYGYCITAHKAQGSEWEEVCVIDERYVLKLRDGGGDLPQRWLYTAVTRASKRLVFADYRWFKASTSKALA